LGGGGIFGWVLLVLVGEKGLFCYRSKTNRAVGGDDFLYDWAEELVDEIVLSICCVIVGEGRKDPAACVEREYGTLSEEQKFVLQYFVAACHGLECEDGYEALAKQNIVDVWEAVIFLQ